MSEIQWEAGPYRIRVSLPESDAPWAVEGTRGLMGIRPLFQGRGPEPRPIVEGDGGMDPAVLGYLGKGF
ncbi:hypothetical protein [Streptomyces sp. G1]|uniref:hypothetical protein n=1 Tax=Streptomyces sp. G1 TaxID=361572 RepID=UPI0020306EEC|nr:hypothetical protein [Streptomyces sp. G1]MCM1965122.1 hypothetical protein [Streptomyces sp. G1]